jgi:hypothetical protein
MGGTNAGVQVEVVDVAGRVILRQNVALNQNPVLDLDIDATSAQVVFVRISGSGQEYLFKVLLPAY